MVKKSKSNIVTPNGFNAQALREFICQENRFITDLLDKLPIPSTIEENDDDDDLAATNPDEPGTSTENKVSARKTNRAKSLEELMSKLKELQGKKPDYKNKLAKKGLKNKLKKRKKNEERLLSKKLVRKQKSGDLKMELVQNEKKPVKPTKPVFNSEGKLVFSKFDFSEIGRKDKDKREERDPKKILKQMEKQKEKIDKLENSGDTEKVKVMKEKLVWMQALKKSQGVKVKDDPELLKKSVKRLEDRKKHSSKKWKSREENVKKLQEDRQKKRNNSLQIRKDRNKQNKMKKNVKKGRVMPGF